MKKLIIALLYFTVVIVFAGMIKMGGLNVPFLTGVKSFSAGSYEAIFLTNGQVYFGKASSLLSSYVKLSDIYYLIQKQPLQAQDANAEVQQPEFTLIKLGGELHGPKDQMTINRNQILFIEELKADSKVVTAIVASRKGK